MRTNLLFLALACGGAALAATPAQTTTYVDGNIEGVSPKTGGILSFDDAKAMELRAGLTTVAVPYADLTHAELGAVQENPHGVPLYKFWARRRHKTETQLLIVNFKDEQGADKTMTLELAQPAAESVLGELESRTGKNFGAKTESASAKPAPEKKVDPMASSAAEKQETAPWWGDQVWKTERNAGKFPKAGSSDQR